MPRINLLLSHNFAEAVRAYAALTDHGFSTRAVPELVQRGLDFAAHLPPDRMRTVCEVIRTDYGAIKGEHKRNESLATYTDGIDVQALRKFTAATGFRPKTRAYRALVAIGLAADQRALPYAADDIKSLVAAICEGASRN